MAVATAPVGATELWIGVGSCGCIFRFQDTADEVPDLKEWAALGLETFKVPSWSFLKEYHHCPHRTVLPTPKEEKEMPIKVRDSGLDYIPAPEGAWRAVCSDVVDLGEVQTAFGMKPMVRIDFEIEEINAKNKKPFGVGQRFGKTLSSKGRLRPFLESWRGRKFTKEELGDFDLETLLGANAQIQIIHNFSDDGRTFANITSIMKLPRGAEKLTVSPDFVRSKDRTDKGGNGHDGPAETATDEDIPF